MRLIGATNGMIRAPFLVEGIVIGLTGALIPLCAMFVLYTKTVVYIMQQFRIMSDIVTFMPIGEIFPLMILVALALGLGIGFFGSFFTIRKYLHV
jgi:cell division transport system permease protein